MRIATISTLLVLGALGAGAAHADLRNPQVAVNGSFLQNYLDSVGETINVLTDQDAAQTLRKSSSGNSAFTLMIEIAGGAAANTIGIYNAAEATPALIPVFPGAAGPGWFAVASFLAGGNLVVNVFDQNANLQSNTLYGSVNGDNFGFYISGPGGTHFTQDVRNFASTPMALFYAGTGINAGQYWLCFEDLAPPDPFADRDFDDAVLLLESVTPTAAARRTWGQVKATYR